MALPEDEAALVRHWTLSAQDALLETLGIEADSIRAVPLAELRDRLTHSTIRCRFDADPYLSRHLPNLLAMGSAVKEPETARMAWA